MDDSDYDENYDKLLEIVGSGYTIALDGAEAWRFAHDETKACNEHGFSTNPLDWVVFGCLQDAEEAILYLLPADCVVVRLGEQCRM